MARPPNAAQRVRPGGLPRLLALRGSGWRRCRATVWRSSPIPAGRGVRGVVEKQTSLSGGTFATSHSGAGAAGRQFRPGRARAGPGHRAGNRCFCAARRRSGLLDGRADARRKAGRNAPIQADGSVSKSAAAPLPWTSQEVTTPYTNAPTRTHGKVFFTLGGVDYVCSGTALLSGNKSVVWTAGHCVYDPAPPGDFATNWNFAPAYKDGSAPLGVYVASNLFTSSAWGNSGDFSYYVPRRRRRAGGRDRVDRPRRRARDLVRTTTARRITFPTAIRRRRRSMASGCGRATRRCRPATTGPARRPWASAAT